MILYHGSNVPIETVDLSKSNPFKDFGRGFYLTSMLDQAQKMAFRTSKFYGGTPSVTSFRTPDDLLERGDLSLSAPSIPYQSSGLSLSSTTGTGGSKALRPRTATWTTGMMLCLVPLEMTT